MSKNLNFRAWFKPDADTEDGPLKFVSKIIPCEKAVFIMEKDEEISYPFEIPFIDDDWIVERSTGLTDKNEKEIFEGDIISYSDREEILVIQWRDEFASFGGIIYLEFNGFDENGNETWRSPDYDSYRDMDEFTLNDCGEVIGNVFENQELLK